ncbi:MAG: polyphenol oxidase family protein [Candidatus Hydrothermales bacterium]
MMIKKRILNNLFIAFINEKPNFDYFSLEQVHGDDVYFVEDLKGKNEVRGDGLITKSGKVLCVKTADCIPLVVLTYNPYFYGIFHVGWRGLFGGIIKKGIQKFINSGFKPSDLFIYLGPSICSYCYEVGEEFTKFDRQFLFFRNGKYFYDLRGKCVYELLRLGIKNIDISEFCTYESDYFPSYRKKRGEKIYNCVMPLKFSN